MQGPRLEEARIASIPRLIIFKRDNVGFPPKSIINANLLRLSIIISPSVIRSEYENIRLVALCGILHYQASYVVVRGDLSRTIYIMFA